jgi:hypothetical protein
MKFDSRPADEVLKGWWKARTPLDAFASPLRRTSGVAVVGTALAADPGLVRSCEVFAELAALRTNCGLDPLGIQGGELERGAGRYDQSTSTRAR